MVDGDTIERLIEEHSTQIEESGGVEDLYKRFEMDKNVVDRLFELGFNLDDTASFMAGLCIGLDIGTRAHEHTPTGNSDEFLD